MNGSEPDPPRVVPWKRYIKDRAARCIYCGGRAQVDEHVLPRMKAFDDYPCIHVWNVRPACWPCNTMKGNIETREYAPEFVLDACMRYPGIVYYLSLIPVGVAAKLPQYRAWDADLRKYMGIMSDQHPEDRALFDSVELAAMAIYEAGNKIEEIEREWENERGQGECSI